jgi:hypothetical protein
MLYPNDRVTECRREASLCFEVARQMSLRSDRQRMTDMAMQWLAMAQDAAFGAR